MNKNLEVDKSYSKLDVVNICATIKIPEHYKVLARTYEVGPTYALCRDTREKYLVDALEVWEFNLVTVSDNKREWQWKFFEPWHEMGHSHLKHIREKLTNDLRKNLPNSRILKWIEFQQG